MGRIFSPEAIETGDIPAPGAHQDAAHFLLSVLYDGAYYGHTTPYDTGSHGAYSMLVYGSTTTGQANVRSDLDVIIRPWSRSLFHRTPKDHMAAIRMALADTRQEFKVHIEDHIIPDECESFIEHPLDPFYIDHLLQAQEDPKWSRNWPVQMYRDYGTEGMSDETLSRQLRRYAGYKLGEFTKAGRDYKGVPDLGVFQHATELPRAIGRKMLRTYSGNTHFDPVLAADALDQYVLELASDDTRSSEVQVHLGYPDIAFTTPSADALCRLRGVNEEYDSLLAETIQTGVTQEYRAWLDGTYFPTCQLAGQVALEWMQFLRTKRPLLSLPELAERLESIDTNWY